MTVASNLTSLAQAPLTDAERLKSLMEAVATLSALEGQSSAVRLQRVKAMSDGNRALSDALASKEDEVTEAEVTSMYGVVAQVKILFGNGILDRCHHHLTAEVAD